MATKLQQRPKTTHATMATAEIQTNKMSTSGLILVFITNLISYLSLIFSNDPIAICLLVSFGTSPPHAANPQRSKHILIN